MSVGFHSVDDVVSAYLEGVITRDEARRLLGMTKDNDPPAKPLKLVNRRPT